MSWTLVTQELDSHPFKTLKLTGGLFSVAFVSA